MSEFKRNSHTLPKMYLKHWARDGYVFEYRLLVSNENVPIWERRSVNQASVQRDIYTHIEDGKEYDNMERWLDEKVEKPATIPLEKACAGEKMTSNDWSLLIDFVMAQYVRTPSFYRRILEWGRQCGEEALEHVAKTLSNVSPSEIKERGSSCRNEMIQIPAEIRNTGIKTDDNHTVLEVSTMIGKNSWLVYIQNCFSNDSLLRGVLHGMKWSIASAPMECVWPTCDTPYVLTSVDTDGNIEGVAESMIGHSRVIIFPLSPKKMLIGTHRRCFDWRFETNTNMYYQIKKVIVDNANMYIYSFDKDEEVPAIRKRVHNEALYRLKQAESEEWFEQYKKVEAPMVTRDHAIKS